MEVSHFPIYRKLITHKNLRKVVWNNFYLLQLDTNHFALNTLSFIFIFIFLAHFSRSNVKISNIIFHIYEITSWLFSPLETQRNIINLLKKNETLIFFSLLFLNCRKTLYEFECRRGRVKKGERVLLFSSLYFLLTRVTNSFCFYYLLFFHFIWFVQIF